MFFMFTPVMVNVAQIIVQSIEQVKLTFKINCVCYNLLASIPRVAGVNEGG